MKKEMQSRFAILIFLLLIFLVLTFVITISVGTLDIPLADTVKVILGKMGGYELNVDNPFSNIIWQLRVPRVLMALFVGAGLAICGVVMQAVVQNPLAEPFLLGISSGGYLGAVFYIMLGAFIPVFYTELGIVFFAFVGALLASFSVIFLSSYKSKLSTTKLILSGMIINAAFQAVANFIVAISGSYESISRIAFWTMGSLNASKWESCLLPACTVIIISAYFYSQYRNLNILLQGDETAVTLGVNVNLFRKLYISIISLMVGLLVSYCGIIGFVGLVIPHIGRALVGANHKRLIPIAFLLGAIFLMIADCVARSLLENMELPIGVFTALVGAPFFAYIMIKKNYSFSN
ncbi:MULTISPECIES: iron ABC transporter permease [Dysgonomonas]|uniref:FecCD family ABC transporter permease n=1 Tax=Dysgonomonas TaxID=156973 RepID=UPI000ADB50EA|nr:iron ABC transporter permease [Dysgonomonas sp. BGC7]